MSADELGVARKRREIVEDLLAAREQFENPEPCDRCGRQYGPKVYYLDGELHETGDEFCRCPIDWEDG